MSFKMLLSNKNSPVRTARQQHSQQYLGEFLSKNLSKTLQFANSYKGA